MKIKGVVLILSLLFFVSSAFAMKGSEHSGHDMSDHKMDHGSMAKDHADASPGVYKHTDKADGLNATFQVMSLASMNMKDPEGKTHHIMASFSRNDQKMKEVAGNIVVVSPTGKEQAGRLIHFGGGMYAVNFTFDEAGEWQVRCQIIDRDKEYTKEFKYPHHTK